MKENKHLIVPVDGETFQEIYDLLVAIGAGDYDDLGDVELDASELVPKLAKMYLNHFVKEG